MRRIPHHNKHHGPPARVPTLDDQLDQLNANRPRRHSGGVGSPHDTDPIDGFVGGEARCEKCGESFNPHGGSEASGGDCIGVRSGPDGDDDLYRHFMRADEQECGGEGVLVGVWS